MPNLPKYLKLTTLTLFVGIGFISCSKLYLSHPVNQAELKPKSNKNVPVVTVGFAERLENDFWKLSLICDNLKTSDIKTINLIDEPYHLTTRDEDDKLVIAWEVTPKRWLKRDAFDIVICLNDSSSDNILISVKHPARTKDFTPLGHVVGWSLSVGLFVIYYWYIFL